MTTTNYIFYIPKVEATLVNCAKRHFENRIYFSSGVRCPQFDCTELPFPDSEILFLHILIHKKLLFLCAFCHLGFSEDNLLTEHFINKHSQTIGLQEHLELRTDIVKSISEKWTYITEKPKYVGSYTFCSYNKNASLVMVCKFPQTGKFIGTGFEVKEALQRCFLEELSTKTVQCPFTSEGVYCNREFETCRELVLHMTSHFGVRAICINCYQFYYNINEAAFNSHLDIIHNECITCDRQFHDWQSLFDHKNVVSALTKIYKTNSPTNTDVNCALYLPNLAFHHRNVCMIKINQEIARQEDHHCTKLSKIFKSYLNLTDGLLEEIIFIVRYCIRNQVVNYSKFQNCYFTECKFQYSTCRVFLVHILLIHSSTVDCTYFCNICYVPYADRNLLQSHIIAKHGTEPFCQTCLLSFDSKLNLAIHQYKTGHIPQ